MLLIHPLYQLILDFLEAGHSLKQTPTLRIIASLLLIGLWINSDLTAQIHQKSEPTFIVELSNAPKRMMRVSALVTSDLSAFENRQKDVEVMLQSQGYIAYSKQLQENHDTVFVRYDAGSQYKWSSLQFSEEVAWAITKGKTNPRKFQENHISPTRIEQTINRSLNYLENNGFPFARFQFQDVLIEGNAVSATLVLDKGRLVHFDSIIVNGTADVRETFLTNFLGIKEGNVYREKSVLTIPRRIESVRFVKMTRPPTVSFEEDATKVNLYLDKASASSFDGIIGFLPDPDNGSILITGDVKLHLENSLKQGEIIDVNWRKLQTNTQELKVMAITPFLFNSGFSLDGDLRIYRRDTLFTDVMRQIGVRYAVGSGGFVRLFYERVTTDLISTSDYSSGVVPPYLDRVVNAYGLGYRWQNLDYLLNPSSGFDVDVSSAVGTKQIVQNERLPESIYEGLTLEGLQWTMNVKAAYFKTLVRRLVWHQMLLGSTIYNQQLFNNEALRIGGLRTMRGFDEESIFATSYAILKSELRYQLDRDGYLFGFFDGAWYENASIQRIGQRRSNPYAFGLGIAFGTKAGNFSLSYALGGDQVSPVQLRASKIHFGFISLF